MENIVTYYNYLLDTVTNTEFGINHLINKATRPTAIIPEQERSVSDDEDDDLCEV